MLILKLDLRCPNCDLYIDDFKELDVPNLTQIDVRCSECDYPIIILRDKNLLKED